MVKISYNNESLETATTTTSFSTISIIEVWGKQMMMPK